MSLFATMCQSRAMFERGLNRPPMCCWGRKPRLWINGDRFGPQLEVGAQVRTAGACLQAHPGSVVSVRCWPVTSLGLATVMGALIADTTGAAVVPLCTSANTMSVR